MDDPLSSLRAELASLDERHLTRHARVVAPDLLNLSANDSLGLASHPAIVAAARASLDENPFGAGAARLVSGTRSVHLALEREVAEWLGTDAALLFNSGYHANLGVLATLLGPEDAIFSDALNHASLIDGCRLSRARVTVYRHLDLADLDRALRAAPRARRRAIVTEGLFSMDGDRPPISDLAALAELHGAMLIVDDAHAFGAFGSAGRGTFPDGLGAIRIGTFGKALGSFGAFVAGPAPVVRLLLQRARTFVFTTALPPAVVAANRAGVSIVRSTEGDLLRARLAAAIARISAHLRALDLPPPTPTSHILPLRVRGGDPESALRASAALAEHKLFVQAIRPPTVPSATARLRLSLCATLSDDQLARLESALTAIRPLLEAA